MKSCATYIFPLVGLLVTSVTMHGDLLRFEFEDTPEENFVVSSYTFGDSSYTFGDVVNGVVVMDSDSGAFSVTWNFEGVGFQSPMHLILHLKNDDVGNMVSLSGHWNGGFDANTVTFSSDDLGFSPEPGFIGWRAGQSVSTSESIDGSEFISGSYSENNQIIDAVEFSGQLIGDSDNSGKDIDSDGIEDDMDEWNQSDTRDTVFLLGINTWIPNRVSEKRSSESGHTLADIIQLLELAAAEDSKNHGQYVQELVRNYRLLIDDGLITQKQHTSLIRIIVKHGK